MDLRHSQILKFPWKPRVGDMPAPGTLLSDSSVDLQSRSVLSSPWRTTLQNKHLMQPRTPATEAAQMTGPYDLLGVTNSVPGQKEYNLDFPYFEPPYCVSVFMANTGRQGS